MNQNKYPAAAYLREKKPVAVIQARVPVSIKISAMRAARRHHTSLNKFTHAALDWYIMELKEDAMTSRKKQKGRSRK